MPCDNLIMGSNPSPNYLGVFEITIVKDRVFPSKIDQRGKSRDSTFSSYSSVISLHHFDISSCFNVIIDLFNFRQRVRTFRASYPAIIYKQKDLGNARLWVKNEQKKTTKFLAEPRRSSSICSSLIDILSIYLWICSNIGKKILTSTSSIEYSGLSAAGLSDGVLTFFKQFD